MIESKKFTEEFEFLDLVDFRIVAFSVDIQLH